MKNPFKYFSLGEIILWLSSVTLILVSFLVFGKDGYLSLIASLVGVTSLIFIARGNPIGQVLIIFFCILYGIISYEYAYYGEMATYLFMSAPHTFAEDYRVLVLPDNVVTETVAVDAYIYNASSEFFADEVASILNNTDNISVPS